MEINKNLIKNMTRKIIKSIVFLIYTIFILSLIAGGISTGIMTLIPDAASKPCYLGYYAHCSFTPYSTLILFVMAIIGIVLFLKLLKYVRRQYKKLVEAKLTIKTQINR